MPASSVPRLRPETWDRGHRPWALPACPWAAALALEDLTLLHWPVDPQRISRSLPPGLAVDTYDGRAWLGLVLFRVQRVRARISHALQILPPYMQVCARTYVTCGDKPGLYFLGLHADCPPVIRAAQAVLGMNIHHAQARLGKQGPWLGYRFDHAPDGAEPMALDLSCRPLGVPGQASAGSLAHFLLERYCVYLADNAGTLRRGEFHHLPWRTQPAEARVRHLCPIPWLDTRDTTEAPLVSFAPNLELALWLPKHQGPAIR